MDILKVHIKSVPAIAIVVTIVILFVTLVLLNHFMPDAVTETIEQIKSIIEVLSSKDEADPS